MPLSENLLKILEFARKKAKDPEFLARTAHRRPPKPALASDPTMLTPSEIERLRRLKKTIAELPASRFRKRPAYLRPIEGLRAGDQWKPPAAGTFTPPRPYLVLVVSNPKPTGHPSPQDAE
jgi:hypothetical protein